jgi:hypothetical protein
VGPLAILESPPLPQTINMSTPVARYGHSYALIRDQEPPTNYTSFDDVLLHNGAVRITTRLRRHWRHGDVRNLVCSMASPISAVFSCNAWTPVSITCVDWIFLAPSSCKASTPLSILHRQASAGNIRIASKIAKVTYV